MVRELEYIDTHCHIHEPEFFSLSARDKAYEAAIESGVSKMLLVGTSLDDSRRAVEFCQLHTDNLRAAVGIHPHEASKLTKKDIDNQLKKIGQLARSSSVIAIGECGFDFYYNDRSANLNKQRQLLEGQLEIAVDLGLPVSFHIRSAFADFWPVFEQFSGIKGVLHSFTDTSYNLETALGHDLMIGINGIATFTKDSSQLRVFKEIPLDKIVLETDAPFLTPTPYRGTINEPKNVKVIAEFLAKLYGKDVADIATQTTKNAKSIFSGL